MSQSENILITVRAVLVLLLFISSIITAPALGCLSDSPAAPLVIMTLSCPTEACPHGTPVQLWLLPLYPPGQPGGDGIPNCGEVTWNFGDGSADVVTGGNTVVHTWTEPGNYVVTATVQSSTGLRTFTLSRVFASTVARVEMTESRVLETAPSKTLTFVRSGETERRVSATFGVYVDPLGVDPVLHAQTTEIIFEAGETTNTIELPLFDNEVYDGTRLAYTRWAGAAGGVVLSASPILWIEDDESQPTLAAQDVVVLEGDGGRARVSIPVQLSAPVGTRVDVYGTLYDGTARIVEDYDWLTSGVRINAGELSGVIQFDVLGDADPELDEQLTFVPNCAIPSSFIYGPPVNITIVNDDAALTPRRNLGLVDETLALTLYPGEQSAVPRSVAVRSTDDSVASVPATLTLPAGAASVPLEVALRGEGHAAIEVNLGTRVVTAHVEASLLRALVGRPSSLRIAEGATSTVTLSLSPAHEVPVTVMLTGNPRIISTPASVTIPAGGEVTFEVRALSPGATAIGVTTAANSVAGTSVFVDVTPPVKRRRSMR